MSFTESENWLALFESVSRISKSKGAELDQESDEKRVGSAEDCPDTSDTYPQNMIAQSQSGTGKTATFLLAMLSRISTDVHYCQCLCMAPTRELALQIESVGRQMAQFMTEVSFATAVRSPRVKVDSNGYVTDQIVIGTPGTIANWFRGTGEYRIDPSKVVMFVLDEADIMIEEEGFLNICMRVKKQVRGFFVFPFLYNSNRPFFKVEGLDACFLR
ncbi:unnamed protein product [Schistosoma mattheei]|uniref:Helicase ATP-binding domain-containing protein n=1 Tax=Schistosoma mattheei TaxID=31246 RepID=A0A183P0V2_9TREM|nr:unnamed protein product [Schistosoma mattheei]